MSVVIHKAAQGSPEWAALRADHNTASEASAIMGASKNTSRNELLQLKATGSKKEFSAWQQRNLLDKGHGVEAKARPLAEEYIGDDLFPVTISNTDHPGLLASLDGMNERRTVVWECKSWNEAKAACVARGELPDEDFWQVIQQLMLSGASVCVYTLSDGTRENTLHMQFEPDPRDYSKLVRGWAQFDKDVADYQPVEARPEVVAAPVAGLPAITYKLNGLSLTSNLDLFRKAAEKAVADSKKELHTDQDFADREALNKAFSEAETKIKNMREQVIGEVEDIDKFTRELGEIGELIRQARLAGEKQVESRKKAIKLEIRQYAEREITAHIAKINESFGGKVTLPRIIDNFEGVMKNKRNIVTLQGAVDNEVARLKIEADTWADLITANLQVLRAKANNHVFLFRDCQDLVQKDTETLDLLVDQRIRDYEAEQRRQALAANVAGIRGLLNGCDSATADALKSRLAQLEAVQLGDHWEGFADEVAGLKSEGIALLKKALADRQADDESRRQAALAVEPEPDADLQKATATTRVAETAGASGAVAEPAKCRQPDLLAAAQASSNGSDSVEIVNKLELLKAVIRGDVPDHIIAVDMGALLALCTELKRPVPGVTLSKA